MEPIGFYLLGPSWRVGKNCNRWETDPKSLSIDQATSYAGLGRFRIPSSSPRESFRFRKQLQLPQEFFGFFERLNVKFAVKHQVSVFTANMAIHFTAIA